QYYIHAEGLGKSTVQNRASGQTNPLEVDSVPPETLVQGGITVGGLGRWNFEHSNRVRRPSGTLLYPVPTVYFLVIALINTKFSLRSQERFDMMPLRRDCATTAVNLITPKKSLHPANPLINPKISAEVWTNMKICTFEGCRKSFESDNPRKRFCSS